jgi:hypothetical protein
MAGMIIFVAMEVDKRSEYPCYGESIQFVTANEAMGVLEKSLGYSLG